MDIYLLKVDRARVRRVWWGGGAAKRESGSASDGKDNAMLAPNASRKEH